MPSVRSAAAATAACRSSSRYEIRGFTEQQRCPLGMVGGALREDVREVHERRSRRATSVARSHRHLYFVNAGPNSGLTWQFWILPTHIESSWRP